MPAPAVLLGLRPFIGGISGAINPPTGLTSGQGFARGFARGVPFYNAINSLVHAATGTTGQWGDPANNPINHPQNFGGAPAAQPAQQPAGPMGPVQGGNAAPAGLGSFLNAYPGAFGSFPQLPGEISAGGAVAGFDSVNGRTVYNPRGVIPAGAPGGPPGAPPPGSLAAFGPGGLGFNSFARTVNPYDPNAPSSPPSAPPTGAPGWASVFSNWIAGRNQP